MIYTIAVDGPVGAGKSSVASQVAQKLGILHLDTGAMYRAFAWKALKEGIALDDEKALCELTKTAMPEVRYENGAQHTYMDGQDVNGLIRTPEISMATSTISKVAGVRRAMVAQQQALAKKQSVLMDGRDIGTVVLPKADVKIFLTADPAVRAKRRCDELLAKGEKADLPRILKEIEQRDYQDTNRPIAPLKQAKDAVKVDTSALDIDGVVAAIKKIVEEKIGL